MFRRILLDSDQSFFTLLAFVIIGIVFVLILLKVLTMGKKKAKYMSRLPLEDQSGEKESTKEEKS